MNTPFSGRFNLEHTKLFGEDVQFVTRGFRNRTVTAFWTCRGCSYFRIQTTVPQSTPDHHIRYLMNSNRCNHCERLQAYPNRAAIIVQALEKCRAEELRLLKLVQEALGLPLWPASFFPAEMNFVDLLVDDLGLYQELTPKGQAQAASLAEAWETSTEEVPVQGPNGYIGKMVRVRFPIWALSDEIGPPIAAVQYVGHPGIVQLGLRAELNATREHMARLGITEPEPNAEPSADAEPTPGVEPEPSEV